MLSLRPRQVSSLLSPDPPLSFCAGESGGERLDDRSRLTTALSFRNTKTRALHGQPLALLPSFREQTPLHLQLDVSVAADDISRRKNYKNNRNTREIQPTRTERRPAH